MSAFDSVRPSGVMPPGMVPGASDYIRWDITASKSLNGDAGGTSPGDGIVAFQGTPGASIESISATFTTGGLPGTAVFEWSLNGVVQATISTTVALRYSLGTTGMSILLAGLPVPTGAVYTWEPWAPTSPIVIGGQGLSLPTGSTIQGGVTTENGGSLSLAASALGNLQPARTRTISMGAIDMRADGLTAFANDQVIQEDPLGSLIGAATVDLPIPSRYLHHNDTSQLLSITVYFQILTRPNAVPGSSMQLSLVAVDSSGSLSTAPYLPYSHIVGAWASGSYSIGNYVTANANAPGHGGIFKATAVTGATGASEPTWVTSAIGATTTDGGVTWSYIGGSGIFIPEPSTPDAFYAGGLVQSLTINLDPAQNCTLDLTNNHHALRLSNVPYPIIVTGFSFSFGDITSLAFY